MARPAEVELPKRRDHVVQVWVVLLDVAVERQQVPVRREVADVGRVEDDEVDGVRAGDELGLLLAVDVGERNLDRLQLDARLQPLGHPEAEHVHVVAAVAHHGHGLAVEVRQILRDRDRLAGGDHRLKRHVAEARRPCS